MLKAGDEVYVLGRSQKRGYLVVEHTGQQLHLPHHYTELRVGGQEWGRKQHGMGGHMMPTLVNDIPRVARKYDCP